MDAKKEMRLFVSVDVPNEIKNKVAELSKELPIDSIRAVKPENMHLTLRFIGDTPLSRLGELGEALRNVKFSPFRCKIKGVGVFPSENYIKVVWAGVESPELDNLAKEVIGALKGFGGDNKFTAHLTIARVRRKIDAGAFLEKHKDDEFGEFDVESFQLMQSILSRAGPSYSLISSFPQ